MNKERPVEISICIPVYKKVDFLKRLLESVKIQTFPDYEIIITDDTPDDSIETLVKQFSFTQPVKYFKNSPALGTPENWNETVRRASGKWIKMMHNDDWFASEHSLQRFYDCTEKNQDCSFFFSAFRNIIEGTGISQTVKCDIFDRLFLKMSPLHLFKKVYVGNPSCTLIRRDIESLYDRRFKFVVDFEYYIRCFRQLKKYMYLNEVLINVGFHDEQVTKYTFLVPEIQIPENILLLEKLGTKILKNPFVYDYYWRLFRNLKIRDAEEIKKYYSGAISPLLVKMIRFQSRIAPAVLKKGLFSKLFMTVNYIVSFFAKF